MTSASWGGVGLDKNVNKTEIFLLYNGNKISLFKRLLQQKSFFQSFVFNNSEVKNKWFSVEMLFYCFKYMFIIIIENVKHLYSCL